MCDYRNVMRVHRIYFSLCLTYKSTFCLFMLDRFILFPSFLSCFSELVIFKLFLSATLTLTMGLTSVFVPLLFAIASADSFSATIDLSNVTNPAVSKYIFGMNMYQAYGENEVYTGNYTLGRFGGNAQTRFNYKINAQNSGADYYFITQAADFTWQEFYEQASANGLDFWTQIPAMVSFLTLS